MFILKLWNAVFNLFLRRGFCRMRTSRQLVWEQQGEQRGRYELTILLLRFLRSCPDITGLTLFASYGCDPAPQHQTRALVLWSRVYIWSAAPRVWLLLHSYLLMHAACVQYQRLSLIAVNLHFRMQDGSWNQPLPISHLLKDLAGGRTLEGDGGVYSEAFSDGEPYLDRVTELDSGEGDFADLTAFLSAEEINRSLDLAREAFGDQLQSEDGDTPFPTTQEQVLQHTSESLATDPSTQPQTKAPTADEIKTFEGSSAQNVPDDRPSDEAPLTVEKAESHKSIQPVYKQDKPRLVHEGLELNERSSSATEFCSRAATFIEELSSIFKSSAHHQEEDSSSPDSGYLSPRSRRPAPQGSVSAPPLTPSQPEQTHFSQAPANQPAPPAPARQQPPGAPSTQEPLSPPCFLQKLKSQEVAEGSPIHLECRVTGNPQPLVRWGCGQLLGNTTLPCHQPKIIISIFC